MKHEQLSYHDALKFLAKKYNIEVQERELSDEEKEAYNERESLLILNEYARDYFVNILHNHIEGKTVGLSYFQERGFRDDIIRKFQLGYSLEQRDALTQEALRNGYKKEYLIKTGLTIEGDNNYMADRFRGRVIFPVHSLSGKIVAFGGRILKKAENTGKYVNSPESEVYHKGRELYGIYFAKQAISKEDCCFLVEGYTDVISMHQAGIENVVSSSGTALTHGQIKLIHRFTSNVTVIYDGDAAGIKAALRGIDLLLKEGINIKVVLLPDGEDPDSFARKQNATSFKEYIKENETDFIRFKTQLLLDDAGNDPIKRAALITDIVNSISIIPDNIIRTVYIKDCSTLLNIDERVLVQEVKKKRLNLIEKEAEKRPSDAEDTDIVTTPENQQKAVVAKVKKSPIDKYELAILYYIIRYGTIVLAEEEIENGEINSINVIDFVKYDLERDGLWFSNPFYKEILEESIANNHKEEFVPERYFLGHPDQEISKIAVEIMSDRYQLSKIHTKFLDTQENGQNSLSEELYLDKNVPRVLTELKNAYISQQIKEIKAQIEQRQKERDEEGVLVLIHQLKEIKEVKKMLDKELGERIITAI
jgi:DNA primase